MITGIVLAGGRSKRMGFNKAQADFYGKDMVLHMVDKLLPVVSSVLISSGNNSYSHMPFPQVADEYINCGPLGGIYSTIKQSSSSLNLVVSCDIPLVPTSILKHIVAKAKSNNAFITVPLDYENRPQMLCAVYHKDILSIIKNQIVEKKLKMRDLLDLVSVEYVEIYSSVTQYNRDLFFNVNTPKALQLAHNIWNKQIQK